MRRDVALVVQIIENSRLSGALSVTSTAASGEIHFDEGLVIGAKSGLDMGRKAMGNLAGAVDGSFEFEKSNAVYNRTIQAMSNTALILDLLRSKDEEEHGLGKLDSYQ